MSVLSRNLNCSKWSDKIKNHDQISFLVTPSRLKTLEDDDDGILPLTVATEPKRCLTPLKLCLVDCAAVCGGLTSLFWECSCIFNLKIIQFEHFVETTKWIKTCDDVVLIGFLETTFVETTPSLVLLGLSSPSRSLALCFAAELSVSILKNVLPESVKN